jgi:hypothetical protein
MSVTRFYRTVRVPDYLNIISAVGAGVGRMLMFLHRFIA